MPLKPAALEPDDQSDGQVTLAAASESRPLVRDVLLRDGSTLRLETPTPADFDDIKEFYDGLSEESRYMRFHGAGRTDLAARAAVEGAALIGSR